MSNEYKTIDLCGRLPYKVRIKVILAPDADVLDGYEYVKDLTASDIDELERGIIYDIKPYLRPMDSMTMTENDEFYDLTYDIKMQEVGDTQIVYEVQRLIDWLNAHHFDYRDLIDNGVAIKAPEGMYDTNNE